MMENGQVLALSANWRVVHVTCEGSKDGYAAAEMLGLDEDGEWESPDCGYGCRYCGNCLGCLRKKVFEED